MPSALPDRGQRCDASARHTAACGIIFHPATGARSAASAKTTPASAASEPGDHRPPDEQQPGAARPAEKTARRPARSDEQAAERARGHPVRPPLAEPPDHAHRGSGSRTRFRPTLRCRSRSPSSKHASRQRCGQTQRTGIAPPPTSTTPAAGCLTEPTPPPPPASYLPGPESRRRARHDVVASALNPFGQGLQKLQDTFHITRASSGVCSGTIRTAPATPTRTPARFSSAPFPRATAFPRGSARSSARAATSPS